jgi:SAM-dependent methyltransferase
MTAQHRGDVKVLFLAGKGRSGGTLLASLLGQIPGFFNAGELNRLWDSGLEHNRRCGCGRPVQECETWVPVLAAADKLLEGTGIAPLATARIDLAQASVVRWPRALRLLRMKPERKKRWKDLDRYTTASSAVYRAIAEVTGARVVVDSSRLPFEPIGLGLVPDTDVHMAQVVRDPRAVVYSWKRKRAFTDREGEDLPRFGAAFSTTSWLVRNIVVEIIGRRRRIDIVQYDEMARDPAAVLRRLAAFVDEPAGDLAFLTSATATLEPTHSVGGNPVRMQSGAIEIKPDEEWRSKIERRDRFVATLLALPLLRRYGLPVRSRAGTAPSAEAPATATSATDALPTLPKTSRPVLTTNAWLRFDGIRHGLGIAQPTTVLEIGAGEGALGAWLAPQYDYTGVELDAVSRATASERLARVGRGQIVEQLSDVGDRRYDLVCAFEVLEHIKDDGEALEQWREYVRPGGWLLLSVPAHQAQYGLFDELVGHYRRYDETSFTVLLEKSGFRVVRLSCHGAGLGQVLETGRNLVARRAKGTGTPEERTSSSGRLMQTKGKVSEVAFATIAAPGRVVQRPFASRDIGTGYVVLARRSE